ncbi:MAG: hypothetical protein Q8R37_03980, partial [Nanoarchaeota archaeon]|nr:hypothetical protein [Nanoarchaeota archaeon]
MKQSRDWVDQNWIFASGLQRRADGYPTQIPQGSITLVRTLILDGGENQKSLVYPAGQYTVLYDGDGDVQFSGDAAVVSQQPGRIIITIQPNEGTYIAITRSNVNNPVRKMRIIMPGYENIYQAKPFYPPFLQRMGNTSTIRLMNVMNTNRGACCYSLSEPQITWNDRTLPDENTQNTRAGMAIEHLVALANTADKSPWFTISHLASDDYVRNFASYVNANLNSNLDIYVEFSNEVWNNIFIQNAYVQQQGCADPQTRVDDGAGGCDIYRSGRMWQGKRSGQIFTLFQQELTDDSRLVRVVASQSGYNGWTASMFNPIFQGLTLVGQTADALSIAPYFGGGVTSTIQQSGQMDSITVDQLLDLAEQNLYGETLLIMKDAAQYAQQKGVRLLAYEGGHHLVATGGFENNQPWADKIIAAAHHPRMRGLYNAY